jgi:flagellar basal body-associated protein FliL
VRGTGVVPLTKEADNVGILWIILIVILVLALLGFFSRGVW